MENIPIYVAHYDKALDRKAYLDSVLPSLNPKEIIYNSDFCDRSTIYSSVHPFAVDVSFPTIHFKTQHSDNFCRGMVLSPQIPQYLGNFMNHIQIWRRIANGESKHAIVLEDDAVLTDDAKNILERQMRSIPNDLEIGYLHPGPGGGYTVEKYLGVKPEPNASWVKVPKRVTRSQCSYILSQSGAKRLLQHIFPISWIIDHELNFTQSFYDFKVYWTVEHAFLEGSFNGDYKSLFTS